MKKSIISFLLIISMLIGFCTIPIFAEDAYNSATVFKIMNKTDVFNLKAKGSILMETSTGNVIAEQHSHDKLPIASITKIMSMILIMEAIDSGKISFDDKVIVSDHSYDMGGSQVWLAPGEVFTVRELMDAVAIHSANDATVALAEYVAGSESTFVAKMNEKAKELGMKDTNFLDCSGLTDDGHYSTAYDIALMSRELVLKHPKILEFTNTAHAMFREKDPKHKISLDNTNKLIGNYDGCIGLKTGTTGKAGSCLSALAVRNNFSLISVVLGEPDSNTRFAETRKLLDYGFANYEISKINNKSDVVKSIEVKKGLKTKVNGIFSQDVNLLIKKGEKSKVTQELKLNNGMKAPLKAGDKLGEVIYSIDGKEIGKADVVAEKDVKKASGIRLFFRMVGSWFGLGKD